MTNLDRASCGLYIQTGAYAAENQMSQQSTNNRSVISLCCFVLVFPLCPQISSKQSAVSCCSTSAHSCSYTSSVNNLKQIITSMAFTKQSILGKCFPLVTMRPNVTKVSDVCESPSSDTPSTRRAREMLTRAESENEVDEHMPASLASNTARTRVVDFWCSTFPKKSHWSMSTSEKKRSLYAFQQN